MQNLFSGDFDVERLVQRFKAETGVDIEASNTLIILDEIQEVPKALTALKYFYENAPLYHIIYWAKDGESRAEIEFIVQIDDRIIPVEIKSGTNLRAKSLKVYIEKYHPEITIRSSQAGYKSTGNLYDVPLYLLSSFIPTA